jgi:hypothetical protein
MEKAKVGGTIRDGVMSIRCEGLLGPKEPEPPCSFVSLATTREMVDMVINDAAVLELDDMEVLHVVGGVGLAFNGFIGNFVDPWTFRVRKVHTDCYLSQCDLWDGLKGGNTLVTPGTKEPITGVVPLRCLDHEAYDLLNRKARSLCNNHASVSMRRVVGEVPYDSLALKSAAALRVFGHLFSGDSGNVSTRDVQCLLMLVSDLRNDVTTWATKTVSPILEALQTDNEDTALAFSGRADVTGSLKPFLALLVGDYDDAALESKALRWLTFWNHRRETSMGYKKNGSPTEAVTMFGSEEAFQAAVPPVTLSVPEVKVDLDDIKGAINPLSWPVSKKSDTSFLWARVRWFRGLINEHKAMGQWDDATADMVTKAIRGSFDHKDDKVVPLGNASHFTMVSKNSLVDIAEMGIDIDLVENAARLVTTEYKYQWQVAHVKEEKRLKEILFERLVTCDFDEFCNLMSSVVKDKNWGDIGELVLAIINQKTPDWRKKLVVIVLGRRKEDMETVIWNNGNQFRGKNTVIKEALSPNQWTWLVKSMKKYAKCYVYPRDLLNRHGHGNDNPSWWALGYQSIDAYREAVGDEEFLQYLHRRHSTKDWILDLIRVLE